MFPDNFYDHFGFLVSSTCRFGAAPFEWSRKNFHTASLQYQRRFVLTFLLFLYCTTYGTFRCFYLVYVERNTNIPFGIGMSGLSLMCMLTFVCFLRNGIRTSAYIINQNIQYGKQLKGREIRKCVEFVD